MRVLLCAMGALLLLCALGAAQATGGAMAGVGNRQRNYTNHATNLRDALIGDNPATIWRPTLSGGQRG